MRVRADSQHRAFERASTSLITSRSGRACLSATCKPGKRTAAPSEEGRAAATHFTEGGSVTRRGVRHLQRTRFRMDTETSA